MTEWAVRVPIYGSATVYVEADSAEDAKAKAFEGGWDDAEVDEWEVSKKCGMTCHRTIHDRIEAEPNT